VKFIDVSIQLIQLVNASCECQCYCC